MNDPDGYQVIVFLPEEHSRLKHLGIVLIAFFRIGLQLVEQPSLQEGIPLELVFCAAVFLALQALAPITGFDQFGSARIVINTDIKSERTLFASQNAMIGEMKVEGEPTIGDDFGCNAGDPGAFVTRSQAP